MIEREINIVVPCYNEEENVPIFFKEVTNVLVELKFHYVIIFVNDGSTDDTLNIIKKLADNDKEHVKYISFSRNFGQESAMYAGLKHTKGDLVTIMDADLQHPPKLLPKMIEILENENFDNVAVRRVSFGKLSVFSRECFVKVIKAFSEICIVNGATDFRLMKRKMVDAVLQLSEYERFSKGIFQWIGFKTFWIECENVKRINGESKWGFKKLLKYGLSGFMDFSVKPLFLSLLLGIILIFSSLFLLLFMLIRNLLMSISIGNDVLIVLAMIFIGGIQLFCVGILSYYVAKIFKEVKNRPHYIIDESSFG